MTCCQTCHHIQPNIPMNLDLMSDPKFFQMITTEEDALLFLQSHGLILSNPYCCNKSMVMLKRSGGKNKWYFFRCNVKDCRREFSLRKDLFLKVLIWNLSKWYI
ncbi:hypothetical protein H311_02761 [Anncaliia algerae PRA109]|nr:hypothetical protein H311_02761 [Anncaliia algerae PRA109]